jgi:hypothetical protein
MSLNYRVNISNYVAAVAKDLKHEYKLSDFEALSLALNAEKNEIIKLGFVLHSNDERPSGLEAIALSLGFKS